MKQLLFFTKQIHQISGKLLYFNLIGMTLISLFESVGIFLLIPLISLAGINLGDSGKSTIFLWISDLFKSFSPTASLLIILVFYVVLMTMQSFLQKKQMILDARIQFGFVKHLRLKTYTNLIQANWSFFLNHRKSDLVNLMTTEVARVGGGTILFLQFLASFIFTFIQIGIAFMLSAKMTLFVLFFGLGLIYCSRVFIKKSRKLGENSIELNKNYLAGLTDYFNGLKDIKSNTLESYYLNRFKLLNEKIEQNIIDFMKVKTTSQFIYKVVSSILIAVFVFFSVRMFKAQPAELLMILIIFSRLWPRFTGIQSNLEQIGSIIPSFKALIHLQEQALESQEIEELEFDHSSKVEINNGLECKNISFQYNTNRNDYALQNICLNIPVNKMTAIVGQSGAGKSTLIDILIGLNQPETGEVLIDRKVLDSRNLLALRRSVSYVSQDPLLFNETIRNNLLVMNQQATEMQMWEALTFAAADFVRKLPEGLDTLIGDRGVKLSGGERQRLVLARAILRKPSILILDEATSALDSENEAKIQEAIEALKGKMTIIVIAHRLSTIRNADQVIVLDHGRVIQEGEFSELANEEGMFSNLLGKQLEFQVQL